MPEEMPVSDSSVTSDGYPKLSAFMNAFPEAAIVRKFGALGMQNLLYLQAEITHLERKYEEIVVEDIKSNESERQTYHKDWWTLKASLQDGQDSLQLRAFHEIREKLDIYSKVIRQGKRCTRC
jgi:hypothetical protein